MGRFTFNTITSLSLLVASLFATWTILSKSNFLYAQIYQLNDLATHIEKYAPQNRNKDNFELTNQVEHVRLFSEISRSVNSGGNGLEDIAYYANNQKIDTLLTEAEISHLQDVSNLLMPLKKFGLWVSLAAISAIAICFWYKEVRQKYMYRPMSVLSSLVGVIGLFSLITVMVVITGPQKVFYIIHEILFEDKAQWFFYFQDSLMTTLMPEIVFANIAVLIATSSAIIWLLSLILVKKLLE